MKVVHHHLTPIHDVYEVLRCFGSRELLQDPYIRELFELFYGSP
jgi:hypothetical protein